MQRWPALFFTVAVLVGASAFGNDENASLPRQMLAVLDEEQLVGASWATVAPDGSIVTGAAGQSDGRRGTPLEPDHKVQIGSITKTLVAVGTLRLVTEGRVRLETPVADLLHDVTIDNPWARHRPLLVRHLLDHTSGLDDARLWQAFSLTATPDTPLIAALLGRGSSRLSLRSAPGATFSYSNGGYTLLGMVIEAVTGERYESYLDRHLLAPLGMTDSTFQFVTQAGHRGDVRLAMGHFEDGVPHPAVPTYLRPASQFTTTPGDMARFARFLLGDGTTGGERFVDPELLRAMGRPSLTDSARAGLEAGYALGLGQRDRHGAVGFCHGGNTVGYRAMLCLYPEERRAFFVSLNADSETADYARIDALLVRALQLPVRDVVARGLAPRDVADWTGLYVPSPSRFQAFAYLDHVVGFATVGWDGMHLRLKPFQSNGRQLIPVGGRLFRADDRLRASHVLLHARDGTRAISDGFQTWRKIEWRHLVPLWLSLVAGLLGLGYLFVTGLARIARGRLDASHPMVVPFVATAALLLPIPFFVSQSFLALGDVTTGSVTCAVVTGLLPLALAIGLVRGYRRGLGSTWARLDALAMAAALQWTLVLAAWGLLPLKLWA